MITPDNLTDAVDRFGLIAEQYCSMVDSRASLSSREFLLQVYLTLPKLISAAIQLPTVTFGDDDDDDDDVANSLKASATSAVTHEEWSQLYSSLKEKLGDLDLYWQVWDPTTDHEAIRGSLADDIADIYRDLQKGILIKLSGLPSSEAAFEWRCGFVSHWGKHALDALRTLHFVVHDEMDA